MEDKKECNAFYVRANGGLPLQGSICGLYFQARFIDIYIILKQCNSTTS